MDPGPDGVYVGWADRFAHHLARDRPGPALRQPRQCAARRRTRSGRRSSTAPCRCGPTSRCSWPASTTCCAPGSTGTDCATTCWRCTPHSTGPAPASCRSRCRTCRGSHPSHGRSGHGSSSSTRWSGRRVRRTARSSSTSRWSPSPATRRCGTTTGCTPTARATAGSPPRSPRPTGSRPTTGAASRTRRSPAGSPGSSRARRTGSRPTWRRGSGDGSAATSSPPAASASGPTCCPSEDRRARDLTDRGRYCSCSVGRTSSSLIAMRRGRVTM